MSVAAVAPSETTSTETGVSVEVLVAVALVAVAVMPVFFGLPHDEASGAAVLPLLAWPLLGAAGIVVLDREPGSLLGRACVAATPLPGVLLLAWVALDPAPDAGAPRLASAAEAIGPVALLPLALPALAVALCRETSRSRRRWRFWTTTAAAVTLAVACSTWLGGAMTGYGASATAGIGAVGFVVAASALGGPPRPVVEPLLDALLVLAVVVGAAACGVLVLWFSLAEDIVAPQVLGGLAAGAGAALGAPLALAARRELTRRRYGRGVLSPRDLTLITADLADDADPRELLGRAAAVVTAASGVTETRILMDEVEASPGWAAVPLAVGDQAVGTVLVRPSDPGGLEARQERTIEHLAPTLALAARAVALAVDAEHARRDLVRQRDLERARILDDLHDDLGPVLAGMSMRVAALQADHPVPGLETLGDDLAACRADLRRIVADLAPPALESHELAEAVAGLVASFGEGPPRIVVREVACDVDLPRAVVAYRTVAEGLANAVRHADADRVEVAVVSTSAGVRVRVTDDGTARAVVPGTGLSSLRHRAEQLGGTLRVTSASGAGTTLVVELPERPA